MTTGLAFINQYLANVPHMRHYLASLCPALEAVEAKKVSSTSSQGEISMRSKNTASHIGHVGKKPELKHTPNGTPYSRFSLACNYSFKKDGNYVNDVDWIPLIAYGKLAETVVKYLDKGSHVSVESRLKPWKSGTGKNTSYGLDVVVTDILFLDPKDQAESPEHLPAEVLAADGAPISDDAP